MIVHAAQLRGRLVIQIPGRGTHIRREKHHDVGGPALDQHSNRIHQRLSRCDDHLAAAGPIQIAISRDDDIVASTGKYEQCL